jgi:2-dehydropantoate 2-reductase
MHICVFGAGSLGSLVGGLLADDHEVHLVGREPHVRAVREDGLRVTGEFDRRVHPSASTEPPAESDLAIVTVKSFDTEAAARALGEVSVDTVLSLQNGMGNEELLGAYLAAPVLAGTCTYGARLSDPGVVECTGLGEVTLGPYGGGMSAAADRAGEALAAGLETTVAAEMPRRLWEKLAVNAGINAATALARVPNGHLVDGPAGEVARNAARETVAVAASAGVDIPDAPERTVSVAERTASNTSSMHQDVLAGGRTEIDAINGYVVEQADGPVPVNATLTALVRAWEREQGHRC